VLTDYHPPAHGDLVVEVDVAKCESYANCVAFAPDVFDLDDDDYVSLLRSRLSQSDRERIVEAARLCPTGAIQLVSD
jgi:ferredoxin